MNREEAKTILAFMVREQELSVNNDRSNYEALSMALDALKYDDAKYHEEHGEVVVAKEVWEDAVQALETVSHLKDRPCEACEYHSDRGCSKWDCVFDKVL